MKNSQTLYYHGNRTAADVTRAVRRPVPFFNETRGVTLASRDTILRREKVHGRDGGGCVRRRRRRHARESIANDFIPVRFAY